METNQIAALIECGKTMGLSGEILATWVQKMVESATSAKKSAEANVAKVAREKRAAQKEQFKEVVKELSVYDMGVDQGWQDILKSSCELRVNFSITVEYNTELQHHEVKVRCWDQP